MKLSKQGFEVDTTKHVNVVALIDKKGSVQFYNCAEEIEPWLLQSGQLGACLSFRLDYTPGEGLTELYKKKFGKPTA